MKKDIAFVVESYRMIDVTDLILDQIFLRRLVPKGERHHTTILSMEINNCFRTATFLKKLTSYIELDEKGVLIMNAQSILHGSGDTFEEVFVNDGGMYQKICAIHNEHKYPTIIFNLMDFGSEVLKYIPNDLNGLMMTNRSHKFDAFILVQQQHLETYRTKFQKILSNCDNFVAIKDFNLP